MTKETSYGILAAIDWNSNDWQGPSTPEDLEKANFTFVKENDVTNASLNFGHTVFPADENGYYRGFLPHLFAKTPDAEKSKTVKIVILKSKDWHDGNTYIVGFYAFPTFKRERIKPPVDEMPEEMETNIKSLVKHIHFLENRVNLSVPSEITKSLPKDKKPGKMGYNYLNQISIERLLDVMSALNPDDKKLSSIKLNLFKAMGYSMMQA